MASPCKCQPFKQALDCPVHPMKSIGTEKHRLKRPCMACQRSEGVFMCVMCAALTNAEAAVKQL